MQPELVLFDLDGTLLNIDHEVLPCSLESIQKLLDNGIQVCITTGRCFNGAQKALVQFPEKLDILASIHNGAAIVAGEEVLHDEPMTTEDCLEIVDKARRLGMRFSVQSLDKTYVDSDPGPYTKILEAHGMLPIWLNSFEEIPKEESILKIAIFGDSQEQLDTLLEQFHESPLSERLNLFQSGFGFADATSIKASKKHSGNWIASHYNIKPEKILAFGDQMNDRDMIKWAGHGVAMGNAHPTLKEHANAITKNHNEGGISHYLKEVLGII